MTPVEVLTELTASGIRAAVEADRIVLRPTDRVTAEIVAVVRDHKPALLTLLLPPAGVTWRVEAMRRQVPAHGPIPLLCAVLDLPPMPGRCFSCYAVLPYEPTLSLVRCTECALAVSEAFGGPIGLADAARAGRFSEGATDAKDDSAF